MPTHPQPHSRCTRLFVAALTVVAALAAVGPLAGCGGDPPDHAPVPLSRLKTNRGYLIDSNGRYIIVHGINVSGSTKVPATIDGKPLTIADLALPHNTGTPSYLGKPFAVDDADAEWAKLRDGGFNAVRLLINWEGVEPSRRGEYDQAYLASLRAIVQKANDYGLYILLDMHQDMWSRHLLVRYNETPSYKDPKTGETIFPPPGSVENGILALFPPYTDTVRGEGAPRWAVEACLQEKDLDSPNWGKPRLLSGLDADGLIAIAQVYGKLMGGDDLVIPPWVNEIVASLPPPYPVTGTVDPLPFTNWGVSAALSLDVARCFACFFAGDVAFPKLRVSECRDPGKPAGALDGCTDVVEVDVKSYLQDAYAAMWQQVVEQVADLPNVMGYDVMNEPIGNFLALGAVAVLLQTGIEDNARQFLVDSLGEEDGQLWYELITKLRIFPTLPDKPAADAPAAELAAWQAEKDALLKAWGRDTWDFGGVIGLNYAFDLTHMRPFYGKAAAAILARDPKAVIFIEPSMNIGSLAGGELGGMWDTSMTRPEGVDHLVYAPHYYADVYPFLGINAVSRDFSVEEVQHRDYQPFLEKVKAIADFSLGKAPVVFGEFGTYFNFGGIDKSHAAHYVVSSHILDNYFEAFERMFQSQMLWCYTPDNDKHYGDKWNKEDFSIQGFDGQMRSADAWSRPYPRALAGKPVSTHFYSRLHFFDPTSGVVDPEREFEVIYERKETETPTEIVIPAVQYPDGPNGGFYVWLSDGHAFFDATTRILYHYPADDAPGTTHFVRVRPPLAGDDSDGWRYFFKDGQVITR